MIPRLRLAALLLGPLLVLAGVNGVIINDVPYAERRSTYAENPPLGHTGGFGEPTCHTCHFGGELNARKGALEVEGLPGSARPGRAYRLTVVLNAEMKRSGFMLAVRHSDGSQAGRLDPIDTGRVAVGSPDTSAVQYAFHTKAGTDLNGTTAEWDLRWTAPETPGDSVFVHVSANAANDDASEFGDDVYATVAGARIATDAGSGH